MDDDVFDSEYWNRRRRYEQEPFSWSGFFFFSGIILITICWLAFLAYEGLS